MAKKNLMGMSAVELKAHRAQLKKDSRARLKAAKDHIDANYEGVGVAPAPDAPAAEEATDAPDMKASRTYLGGGVYECNLCNDTFDGNPAIDKHLADVHGAVKTVATTPAKEAKAKRVAKPKAEKVAKVKAEKEPKGEKSEKRPGIVAGINAILGGRKIPLSFKDSPSPSPRGAAKNSIPFTGSLPHNSAHYYRLKILFLGRLPFWGLEFSQERLTFAIGCGF
jgi:hypothetical protein